MSIYREIFFWATYKETSELILLYFSTSVSFYWYIFFVDTDTGTFKKTLILTTQQIAFTNINKLIFGKEIWN